MIELLLYKIIKRSNEADELEQAEINKKKKLTVNAPNFIFDVKL